MTPFKAVYGREPPSLIRWGEGSSKVDEVDRYFLDRDRILEELKSNLSVAQERMKKFADMHRREIQFEVGERVFLKIQPYRFKKLAKRVNEKLSPKFYGPYEILERIGPVAYRLQLPPDSKVHPVFHVSQLKKVIGPHVQPQPLPPCLAEDWELKLAPEDLLDFRYTPAGHLEVLIKWKTLPHCENTWEDFIEANDQFPDFHLEDKVKLKGGSADEPLVTRVYARKNRKRSRGSTSDNLLGPS